MIRSAAPLAIALGLSLAGCQDARRDVVRDYLQSHPPAGFEIALIPEDFTITKNADGASEALVAMRYRLTQPTVEIHDIFSLPRGSELANRLATVRGWALSSLPKGDPTRDAITAGSAAARAAFPTKRIVTPAGTEIDSPVVLALRKEPHEWQVEPQSLAVTAPGIPDQAPRIPFEDSPAVTAKFQALETSVALLEESRRKYLADRQRAAERSLARFRLLLKTGNAFEGHLPDLTPVRVVISQGAEAGDSVVAVVTIHRGDHSSARYVGGLARQPSGEAIWRAAQTTSLSGLAGEPLTDQSFHPVLTLTAGGTGLIAEAKVAARAPVSFRLEPAGNVDLIPDTPVQPIQGQ